jgi:hypothetical protein
VCSRHLAGRGNTNLNTITDLLPVFLVTCAPCSVMTDNLMSDGVRSPGKTMLINSYNVDWHFAARRAWNDSGWHVVLLPRSGTIKSGARHATRAEHHSQHLALAFVHREPACDFPALLRCACITARLFLITAETNPSYNQKPSAWRRPSTSPKLFSQNRVHFTRRTLPA